VANSVRYMQIRGRDHPTPRNSVCVRAPDVGDEDAVTSLQALEEVKRPRMRRPMSRHRDRVSSAGASRDRPPRRAFVEPRGRKDPRLQVEAWNPETWG
jgi:hypothetical protein